MPRRLRYQQTMALAPVVAQMVRLIAAAPLRFVAGTLVAPGLTWASCRLICPRPQQEVEPSAQCKWMKAWAIAAWSC